MSWRRILMLSTALVVVLGITTWTLLQHSDVATDLLRKQLSELFRGRVGVESTRLELAAGRLTIEGFELADPNVVDRNLVRIATGHLDVQADPLGWRLEPRMIVVDGFELECGPKWPTLAGLLSDRALREQGQRGPLPVPAVEMRSGRATLHLSAEERPLVLDDLQVTATPLAEAPGILQVSGSARLREPAAVVTLHGEIDVDSGAARIALATGDVSCSQQVVDYLARLAHVDKPGLDIGGEIHSVLLTCQIPPRTAVDRTPRFEFSAECRDVRLAAADLPSIVEHATIRLYADSAALGTVKTVVEQQNDTGTIAVTATFGKVMAPEPGSLTLELRATGRDLVIDADVLAALRSFPIGKRLVEALQPATGRADIDLFLRDPHVPGHLSELDLVLRGVAMSFRGFEATERRIGFPLPLVAASGRVRMRDRVLLLEDMSASIAESAGGGTVTLQGRIDTLQESGEDATLDIDAPSVAFSSDLRAALSTLLRDDGDLYDRLAPSGRAHVNVQVRPLSQLSGGFRVEVQPSGAAMQWAGFPYRLDQLQGEIVVIGDGVRFGLTGRHGDGHLTMHGRIPLRSEHAAEDCFEAVIDLDGLKIDEDLQQAVAVVVPELRELAQKAAPSGRLSGQVKVWRPQPEDPLFHDVRLDLQAVDLQLPVKPWRAAGLEGQVLVQGSGSAARIDFDALRGRLENGRERPAQLALFGHVESGESHIRDLAFVVRDLELCDQLGKSLDELGALGLPTWTSLRPSGRVDLVCRELFGGPGGDDLQVVVQLVDVRSEAPMLPKPAEHMTGELRIQHGELTFRDVRAELGGALVRCWDGRVHQRARPDARTEISFAVHAKDFPVDDGLANLFSGPLGKAVLERKLDGRADVDGLRLVFAVPTADSRLPFSTTVQGQLGLDGVDMQLGTGADGIRVLGLRGVVVLDPSTVNDTGGQLTGTLRNGSLGLFGHPFEAIEAGFRADAERLQIDSLTSRVHNGQIVNARPDAPALTYLLPAPVVPEGRLAADLAFERVDVFSLLTTSGWNNPPYSGSASGRCKLHRLDGGNVVGAEAEGKLVIERANLGKVPLFAAIYAQLPPADQPHFNHLDLTYRLTGQRLELADLEVRSDILAAKGSGALDLDGYLDIRMKLDNLLGKSADPVVMPLIDYLAKNLVRFHLFGHLRDLRAEQRWLTESSPGRRAVPPMAPEPDKRVAPGF